MLDRLQAVGRYGLDFFESVGRATLFLARILCAVPRPRQAFPLLLRQMFNVGLLSLLIIVVSGLFIGMVMALQGYSNLARFGTTDALGTLVALSMLRELGPVVTGLLFAGRAGSAITAEIGLMRATEQLSSLEMIGVDPIRRVVSPRFWAGFYSMPMLALIFNTVAIYGGAWISIDLLGVDGGSYWTNTIEAVSFSQDVVNGVIKSFVFGALAAWIAVYQGYDADPNPQGIASATTRTVVYSSLAILGLDLILTAIMFGDF